MRGGWWLLVATCLVAGLSNVACTGELVPTGAAAAPPPVQIAPEVEALRPLYNFYRDSSNLLNEWSRGDTTVAKAMDKYPPASENEVVQIRRELRRLETVVASMREVLPPNIPGAPPTGWGRVVDLRDKELSLYRQFYRQDWKENA